MKKDANRDKNLWEMARRVKEIRHRLNGISQREFARQIGFSATYMSDIEKGKYSPGFSFYHNMAERFNVNLYYLFFGRGDIFVKTGSTPEIDIPIDKKFGEEADEIKEMLWYMEQSGLVRHSMLSVFSKFFLENQDNIERNIIRNKEKKRAANSPDRPDHDSSKNENKNKNKTPTKKEDANDIE